MFTCILGATKKNEHLEVRRQQEKLIKSEIAQEIERIYGTDNQCELLP